MTRLKEGDLIPIPARLPEYDDRLRGIVGVSLAEIACKAAGVDEKPLGSGSIMARFAAVPMNSGFGVIQGFSAAASAVVSHLGFEAFVTEDSDVAGIVEGIGAGADVLLLADDERYVAMVPEIGFYVDNSPATALGFVTALEIMNGGLVGESVLVLGCGPLGVAASKALIERGAEVGLCDVVEARAQAASRGIGGSSSATVGIETDLSGSLRRYNLIFDATNTGGFIGPGHLTDHTLVAAPGMPCALTPEAMDEHRNRIIHDSLEIGTATMAVQAAAMLSAGETPRGAGGE